MKTELHDSADLEYRIEYLEAMRQWFMDAMELGASLGEFQSSVNQGIDPAGVIAETGTHLKRLLDFKAIAFMRVSEDHSFVLLNCQPAALKSTVAEEINHQIETGNFAWALNQRRSVVTQTRDGEDTMIMHVLSTRTRIRGMFVGLISYELGHMKDAILSLLSIVSLNTANALESYELYNVLNEQNRNLEKIVTKRTTQLEEASAQAESANKAKSQFLADMSHEIRTPLTSIIGYAEILRDQYLSSEQRFESVDTILRTGKHLLDVINDILDLSKIESERIEFEYVPASPFQIFTDITDLIRPQARDKGLDFNVAYEFPIPRVIITDPTRLKQILLNLCSNAIKFTDEGGIHVKLRYQPEQKKISFAVTDTGIGLTVQQQTRVFRSYTQADSSTNRRFGGTGLGLHISKQLAERLGGTITVRSTLGEGSCFEATVRTGSIEPSQLVYSEEELPDAQLSSFNSQPSDTGAQGYLSSKVLLAEDNPDNQRLIALYMRKIGVSVTTVDNGKQALERGLDSGFDLILMDVQMPEMDGLEATEQLRKAGYTGPIVALTANALKEDRDRCHAAGCNDFLSKPIEKVSFYALVGKYLSRATSNRESEEEGEQELDSLLLSHHRA